MEKLFHYVWKHKLFPLVNLHTADGKDIEVVDPGLHNSDAGPDFFNAKVKIAGQMWVGNIELHIKSSQWKQHGHNYDKAYNNVILHVVREVDCDVFNERGDKIPQLELVIPGNIKDNYEQLLKEDRYPRCHKLIPHISADTLRSWLFRLYTERLERKAGDIMMRLDACNGSWEDALFQTLARNFGFGINADAFETWAKTIPLHSVDHHRDNLFQIEAIFLGQAGLLDIGQASSSRQREKMETDDYYQRLAAEYKYLAHKFSLKPVNPKQWRFLRLRPQNFPTIRISQLAQLHYNRTAGLSQLLCCTSVQDAEKALATHATPYWQTHYLFGEESGQNQKCLSKETVAELIINTIVPVLFAYGRYRGNEELAERALNLIGTLKAEENNVIRLWRECGLTVGNAKDSQALLQLKKEYCDRKDCLRCRIGYHYLKSYGKDF